VDEFPIYFVPSALSSAFSSPITRAVVRPISARSDRISSRSDSAVLLASPERTNAIMGSNRTAPTTSREKLECRPTEVRGPDAAATARADKSAAETAKTHVVSPDVDKSETPRQVPADVGPAATLIPTIPSPGELGSAVPRLDAGVRIPPPAPALEVPSIFSTTGGGNASSATTGKKRNWADVEETLGANWLDKLGTTAFVIGVALLLNYSMHYLGRWERSCLATC